MSPHTLNSRDETNIVLHERIEKGRGGGERHERAGRQHKQPNHVREARRRWVRHLSEW